MAAGVVALSRHRERLGVDVRTEDLDRWSDILSEACSSNSIATE